MEGEARSDLFDIYCNSTGLAGAISYNLFQLADAPIELGRAARTLLPGGWEYQFQVPKAVAGDDWWIRVFFRIGQAGHEEIVHVVSISGRRLMRRRRT